MKRLSLPLAVAAIVFGTALIPAQPAEAKSIGGMLESAYNAVRRQTNPNTGYGNLYGNFYGSPYGYPYGTTQPVNNSPWLSSFTNRYLGTGANGQYISNPGYVNTGSSLKSKLQNYAIRRVINRLF